MHDRGQREAGGEQRINPDTYWDLFADACIGECSKLIITGWIKEDDVVAADPSVILSVPAVAVLAVLADTVQAGGKGKTEIWWREAEVTCNDGTRPRHVFQGFYNTLSNSNKSQG